jgi:hypothetical protein
MEINEFQKRLTDEACLLRGKIITGYSLVEYVLADISVRLDLKFPYRIKDRIKVVKQIVDRPEYEAYRKDVHRVCDELLQYEDLRNSMAHGILTLETTPDQTSHRFVLQKYERLATGKILPPHARIFGRGSSRAGNSIAHVSERRLRGVSEILQRTGCRNVRSP